MRAVTAVMALACGCAELGVVTDGSSVSYGKPSRGYLIDGVKLPNSGDGFTTRDMWSKRGNRFGTDELVALLKGVAKRMRVDAKIRDVRLVIADLSGNGGGAATLFHRSHQSGRDVDILYYWRDAEGRPVEPDSMRVFGRELVAKDGSGITVDIPRTWRLVRELLTAEEANVQYIFMYQPIAQALIEHAQSIKEDPVIIGRAIRACRQPGDSAPHNDHLHVRIYCADTDRQFGCEDIGPLDLLAEREAEKKQTLASIAAALPRGDDEAPAAVATAADVWAGRVAAPANAPVSLAPPPVQGPPAKPAAAATPSVASTPPASSASPTVSPTPPALAPVPGQAGGVSVPASFGTLIRARADRVDLRGWR